MYERIVFDFPQDIFRRFGFSFYECAFPWKSWLFRRFYFSSSISLPIPVDWLRGLFILCTHNIWFDFESPAYAAMASPLGPTWEDFFIHDRDGVKWLNFQSGFTQTVCWTRYYFYWLYAHSNPPISYKKDNDCFDSLNIKLLRWSNGTIKLSILRKST